MIGNQPIRQHFVPSSYLKNFCALDQQLHHCILRSDDGRTIVPRWAKGSPDSVGYWKNLYTLPDGEAGDRYCIEKQLAEIDERGIATIRDCLKTHRDSIDLGRAADLRIYIAHLANRVPASLNFKQALEKHLREGMIVGMPNNLGARGIAVDATVVANRLSEFTCYPEYFIGDEDTLLATSDRPVSLYALAEWEGSQWLQPSPVESSLPDCWKKDAIWILPIATQCALLGVRGPKRRLNEILKDQLELHSHKKRAGWINAMTAFHANHVYACSHAVRFLAPNQAATNDSANTENQLVCIEDFVSRVQRFMDAASVRWPET